MTKTTISELETETGVQFQDHQRSALLSSGLIQSSSPRVCLYYKTGAGKSYTALALLRLWDHDHAVVIAPPSTHASWVKSGDVFGVRVECMSHAKFRMAGTKLDRKTAVIADEMHLFGGHAGKGWKKLDRLAAGLVAPLVLASATPSYNDAERVYCVQHILDPYGCKGGFLQFLYTHCITEQDPFSMTPKVQGFKDYANAAEFLAALPGVEYLPDDVMFTIEEHYISLDKPDGLAEFGYNSRDHKMVGSQIEEKHMLIQQTLYATGGYLKTNPGVILDELISQADGPVLVFCNHSTVAEAVNEWLRSSSYRHRIVTGNTPAATKAKRIEEFNSGETKVLVGTASLATGTDGMDKVCDTLIILDDTEDDSLRRQLIGRIMPRGLDTDTSKKRVHRVNLTS